MGKKRIIQKTEEELLKEREQVEKALRKESKTKTSSALKEANVYINSTYNNTIITLTDIKGDALAWKSAGSVGFKGTKKGTSFAASKVASAILDLARRFKIKDVHIYVKGVASGRNSAIRSLGGQELNIISIHDVTPIPHNGCRPKKVRRV
jgi:small subunit ribosomal protein S11